MRCPTCGQAVADASANVCPECGAALPLTLADGAPASDAIPAPPVTVGPPLPAFALPPAPLKPSTSAPPDPGLRRRIALVITTIALAAIALYAGGLGLLALIVHQANAPRPETVIYQNSLKGFPGGWPSGVGCSYGSDGYHIDSNVLCFADTDLLSDVAVTVTVSQTGGPLDVPFGIVIRGTTGLQNPTVGTGGDYFLITSNGQWEFISCNDAFQHCSQVQALQSAGAIHGGQHAVNMLKVRVQGSRFTFFVNQIQVGTATYILGPSSGAVGLVGATDAHLLFTNIVVARVG